MSIIIKHSSNQAFNEKQPKKVLKSARSVKLFHAETTFDYLLAWQRLPMLGWKHLKNFVGGCSKLINVSAKPYYSIRLLANLGAVSYSL